MLIRTSKDKDHPYVIINKTFLEDQNLSLKAKGLLAYCMSKPDGWHFKVDHLKNVLKEGEKAIYSAFRELIKYGYCIQDQERKSNGNFGKGEYVLYEIPIDTNKLKKKVPYCQNRHAVQGNAAPIDIVNNESNKKEIDKESVAIAPEKSLFFELAEYLLLKLKSLKPDIKPPDLKKWSVEMKKICEIDHRNPEKIKKVIDWIFQDDFWKKIVLSPSKLRKHFDKLEIEIQVEKKDPKDSQKEIEKENFLIIKELSKKFPAIKDIIWSKDRIIFTNIFGADDHVTIDDKDFKYKVLNQLKKRKLDYEFL